MIRLGQVLIALGILLVLLPAGNNVLFVGLILIGLGCALFTPASSTKRRSILAES